MKIVKNGGHRLFEQDPETARVVSEMLIDIENNSMDAVRKYSRQFDDWVPDHFELSEMQIAQAIGSLDRQVIEDTDFCQNNVRTFAQAQLATMLPLEIETLPGVVLGHRPLRRLRP